MAGATVLPAARARGTPADATGLYRALQANGEVRVAAGTHNVTGKLQTLLPNNIVGDSRNETILMPSGFADYVLEVGNGTPGPNAGRIARLRFYGAGGNLGCLHLNTLSHMWRLDDLIFSGGPCPALVVDSCWDSNYTDIDILGHVTSGSGPEKTSAVIFRNGCNNIYCRGLRIEAGLSGGIYTDGGPIYIVTGKIDDGFGRPQTAAAITVSSTGYLVLDDFYMGGVENQFHIDVAGTLKLGRVALDGGSNQPAAINDRRAWRHANKETFPNNSSASFGPYIPGLDLGEAEFRRFHPSVSTETPAAVYSKIHPIRQVKNLATRSNGPAQGNAILIGTTLKPFHNDTYKNSFLVSNATGQRRKILASFVGGNLLLEGPDQVALHGDWSIEYCESHDTPIRSESAWVGPEQTLFAVVAHSVSIAGELAYVSAPAEPGYGTTQFKVNGKGLAPGQDVTGLFLVDNSSGEANYIDYGVDQRGFIGVMYDRRSALDVARDYRIVAGHVSTTAAPTFRLVRLVAVDGTVTPDLARGAQFEIFATGATELRVSSPINTRVTPGQRLTLTFISPAGASPASVVWASNYKLAPWVSPAPGHNRSIEFRYNGAHWLEVGRTPADVPN